MTDQKRDQLREYFCQNSTIVLAYFFGSKARGDDNEMSDYDFAFYVTEKDPQKRFEIRLNIIQKISSILRTDNVDVVILNDCKSSELKYQIINEGKLLYDKEPYKVIVEPQIQNEYFDFRMSMSKYGLIKPE
jgi:predicted nucleotidyltransferase